VNGLHQNLAPDTDPISLLSFILLRERVMEQQQQQSATLQQMVSTYTE